MVKPWGGSRTWGSAFSSEGSENALRDDGTDFAGSCGDAVGSGSVAGWEAFTWNDEGYCVRA
jgi:hypothetical protein